MFSEDLTQCDEGHEKIAEEGTSYRFSDFGDEPLSYQSQDTEGIITTLAHAILFGRHLRYGRLSRYTSAPYGTRRRKHLIGKRSAG